VGHVRLGELPASQGWKDIVACLESGDFSFAELADRVADALRFRLRKSLRGSRFSRALERVRHANSGTTDLSGLARDAGISALNKLFQGKTPPPQTAVF